MTTAPLARPQIAVGVTGASGAIYAVRTIAALLEHGCHLELVFSDYGKRLLMDELGADVKVERLPELLEQKCMGRRAQRHVRRAQQQGSGCDARQWQPSVHGHGHRAVFHEDAGGRGARFIAQPHRTRGRCDAQGAAQAHSGAS